MDRKIATVLICASFGLFVGCDREERAAEEVPSNQGGPVEEKAPSNSDDAPAPSGQPAETGEIECPGPACQKACSSYDGDALQKCAQAFAAGCFGPDRDDDACGRFGAPEKRGQPMKTRKKEEEVGSGPPALLDEGSEKEPLDTFGTEKSGEAIELQKDSDDENAGGAEDEPDKRLLERPHPD